MIDGGFQRNGLGGFILALFLWGRGMECFWKAEGPKHRAGRCSVSDFRQKFEVWTFSAGRILYIVEKGEGLEEFYEWKEKRKAVFVPRDWFTSWLANRISRPPSMMLTPVHDIRGIHDTTADSII